MLNFLFPLSALSQVWQSIEAPSRAFDSQRACVATCMLAVFDAVLRTPTRPGSPERPNQEGAEEEEEILLMTRMLNEDGGVSLSSRCCQDARPLMRVARTMELDDPASSMARGEALEYLESIDKLCRHRIFDFRMPEKLEVKKYGATIIFMRSLLERSGFQVLRPSAASPEMEMLTEWLVSPVNSQLGNADSGRAFVQARDMTFLFKFLTTMDTRETELMRRRVAPDETLGYWRLSFEPGTYGRGYARRADVYTTPLLWEAVGFRGVDIDTADIQVKGLAGRTLYYGEGPVVQSPADLSTILEIETPTEDDVLHAKELPNYNDTLSVEESQTLMGYLTVDYVRIPLILGFFASRDRVSYLFNSDLQQLLRAVLFEGGPWVSRHAKGLIDQTPVRLSAAERERERIQYELNSDKIREQDTRLHQHRLLGTSDGLLLNELRRSPAATLQPLLKMLTALPELGHAGVHSPDATFLLYLLTLALDVEAYIVYVVRELFRIPARSKQEDIRLQELRTYHRQIRRWLSLTMVRVLRRWQRQAEHEADIRTLCVVHGFLALVHGSPGIGLFQDTGYQRQAAAAAAERSEMEDDDDTAAAEEEEEDYTELTPEILSAALGSAAFVRNWHGFGLGRIRSQLEAQGDPVQRLLRFLQAHGIATKGTVEPGSLSKWVTSGRPVWLTVGRGETYRAPTFLKPGSEDLTKLPPADVPEDKLFAMLQRSRRLWAEFLDRQPKPVVDKILSQVCAVALRKPQYGAGADWSSLGSGLGRYACVQHELTVDVQSAEVMWRNTGMTPVPDSMTQFADYEALFGRESKLCGVVSQQQHRLWVHLVGTDCDLQEWDEPDPLDQGVGAPVEWRGDSAREAELEAQQGFWTCK